MPDPQKPGWLAAHLATEQLAYTPPADATAQGRHNPVQLKDLLHQLREFAAGGAEGVARIPSDLMSLAGMLTPDGPGLETVGRGQVRSSSQPSMGSQLPSIEPAAQLAAVPATNLGDLLGGEPQTQADRNIRELGSFAGGFAPLPGITKLPRVVKALAGESHLMKNAGEILTRAKAGGFTFNPRTGKFVEKGGYMVGGVPGQKGIVVEAGGDIAGAMKQFEKENAALLKRDGMQAGGWVDDQGRFHIDVSQEVSNADEAKQLMRTRNEIAAWHLDSSSELSNPHYKKPAEPRQITPRPSPGPVNPMTGEPLTVQGRAVGTRSPEHAARLANPKPYSPPSPKPSAAPQGVVRRPIEGAVYDVQGPVQAPDHGPALWDRVFEGDGVLPGPAAPRQGNAQGMSLMDMIGGESMTAAHQMPGTLPGPKKVKPAPRPAPQLKDVITKPTVAEIQKKLDQARRMRQGANGEHAMDLDARIKDYEQMIQRLQKPPRFADMSPDELNAYGRQHGVEGLGNVGKPHMVKLTDGREVNIPGGFEGRFSPYDLFTLKAQGINPNLLPDGVHEQIHRKILDTMMHEGTDDLQLFKGLLFGITSPNSPLTQNMFTLARVMPRSMDDVAKLGKMKGEDIARHFGIDAAEQGGIGTRGSVEYDNVANLARMFSENPSWFRKGANEGWDTYADRIATQVPGLGTKTASLGGVWDNVNVANTSAVDRHMITDAWPELMKDAELMADFEPRAVNGWNNAYPDRPVKNLAELMEQEGGQIFARDEMQGLTTKPVKGVFRNKKGGFGSAVTPEQQATSWLEEPTHTANMNPYYRKILNLQDKVRPQGMSLFGTQWLRWDKMRGRIEPHEFMHPDLHRLPAMPFDDVKAAYKAHDDANYLRNQRTMRPGGKIAEGGVLPEVSPVADPRQLMYWGVGGLLGATAADEYRARGGLLLD